MSLRASTCACRAQLLHEGALEADRRDPRGAGGEPADRLRPVRRGAALAATSTATTRSATSRPRRRRSARCRRRSSAPSSSAAAPPACSGRATASSRSTAGRSPRARWTHALASEHCAGGANERLRRGRARVGHGRCAAARAHVRDHAALRPALKRMVLGVGLDARSAAITSASLAPLGTSAGAMWDLGTSTITHYFDALVHSKARGQLQSAVGITQDTQEAVARGAGLRARPARARLARAGGRQPVPVPAAGRRPRRLVDGREDPRQAHLARARCGASARSG